MKPTEFQEYDASLDSDGDSEDPCSYRNNVTLYFRAELTPEQQSQVEGHCEDCPSCAEYYAQETKRYEEIADVLDEFHAKTVAGEEPSIDEYAAKYSHLGPDLKGHLEDAQWMLGKMETVEFPPEPRDIIESARKGLLERIRAIRQECEYSA
jgi:hypothetical protein